MYILELYHIINSISSSPFHFHIILMVTIVNKTHKITYYVSNKMVQNYHAVITESSAIKHPTSNANTIPIIEPLKKPTQ